MKHILYATTGIALALAVAGTTSAVADVDAFASITKNKDIFVTERITTNKFVTIIVASTFDFTAAAEAQALLNIDNHGNEVNGSDRDDSTANDHEAEPEEEYNIHLEAAMTNSVNNNTGVFGFNQDVGNMTNQGNVVSVSGIARIEAVADAQAHGDQVNSDNRSTEFEVLRDLEGNEITDPNEDPANFLVNKSASMDNSVNANIGIINVNQNAGNMNNQSNGVAAAVGLGAVVALSDADLGQHNSGNEVDEISTVKVGSINNSINGNTGIVNVNQSTGNMNNQGNVVSLAAITSGAFINTNAPTAP